MVFFYFHSNRTHFCFTQSVSLYSPPSSLPSLTRFLLPSSFVYLPLFLSLSLYTYTHTHISWYRFVNLYFQFFLKNWKQCNSPIHNYYLALCFDSSISIMPLERSALTAWYFVVIWFSLFDSVISNRALICWICMLDRHKIK